MTPEQIILVQTSCQRVGPRLPELAARFYAELFRRDPALRPLFTACNLMAETMLDGPASARPIHS